MSKQKEKEEKGSVTSHTPPTKDTRLIGFVFPGTGYTGKTPLDYVVDPKTGRRPTGTGIGQAQWGVSLSDLRKGIKGAILPPVFTWEKGRWLVDFEPYDAPIKDVRVIGMTTKEIKDANLEFAIWVVSGEGTPGDFAFRAYMLPKNRAEEKVLPKHPMMWSKAEKGGDAPAFQATTGFRWNKAPHDARRSYHDSWEILNEGKLSLLKYTWGDDDVLVSGDKDTTKPPPVAQAPVKVQAPALPAGIRFRCADCGHWFSQQELTSHHKANLCPGKGEDGAADWAIMCDKLCGCEVIFGSELGLKTLDHVGMCKPGFPRPIKVKAAKPAETEGGDAVADTATEKKDEAKPEVVLNG